MSGVSTEPIPAQPPEDIRAARPYLLSRSPLKTFTRRVLSIAVLVAIDLSGLVIGLYLAIGFGSKRSDRNPSRSSGTCSGTTRRAGSRS